VPRALNLFGTAHVVVSEHRDVLVVPAPAVLRDDVTGVTRVATVTAQGAVHWVDVTTGVSARGLVEITAPPLPLGAPVVTSGQVGLPEGARVPVEP
jgi:multidrug efflux pump subunit AcrA (membrane-fusion protein)